MHFYFTSSFPLRAILATLVLLSLLGTFFSTQSVRAQEASSVGCSISGYPTASVTIPPSDDVTEQMFTTIAVSSPSGYMYTDVQVGVGLYSESSNLPEYWAMVGDTVDVDSGKAMMLDANIDMRSVEPGAYTMKVFASQGDFDNVLAVALRDGEMTPGVQIQKTGEVSHSFESDIAVVSEAGGSGLMPDSDAQVTVRTTNDSDRPLIDVSRKTLVTKGSIPLGTAVVATDDSAVKLLPGSTGIIETDSFPTVSGEYTVFTTLEEQDTFANLNQLSFVVEGEIFVEDFVYVPGVAITGLNESGVEVVSCVQTTANSGHQLSEPVALRSSLGSRVVFGGGEVDRNLFQTVSYADMEEGVTVFLERQLPLEAGHTEDGSAIETTGDDIIYEAVDMITVSYECEEGECVEATEDMVVVTTGEGASTSGTFYFYLGVVLAAALLMYIMLRRLHPEETLSAQMNENELQ